MEEDYYRRGEGPVSRFPFPAMFPIVFTFYITVLCLFIHILVR